ncbi:BatD family protein [Cupriavidus metallidurans]|uniref:Protein BatD n=1 Tax=Cupriavidus metallidurans (strain ATCC 43123 / DSM 2839 / NBRC 102507 / CH34) TaxID=266264 RepID=Q1LEN1_CUPMC|nr:BatD family protein [Cupriavidus metallidurans]ABF11395.1 conserved hypothetical protein [Cupriavidus metallidurans CH34]QGS33306.1 hypothetical protein FOB83_31680 [Cupriavidus metallidurans]
MIARLLSLIAFCMAALAHAAEPAPIVRVEVGGNGAQRPAVVGQSVQISVTILAPNFFMSAPVFPTLQVAGAVITMPDDRAVNSTETVGGVSYAAITKTYVLTPQSAGDFTLPQPEIPFTYAGGDGKPLSGSVTLPPTVIHAGGQVGSGAPGAASGVQANVGTLPAGPLQITQQFDRPVTGKDAHLRAGDAVVRTITIVAPNAPAMMIQPPVLEAPGGVKLFRADPKLSDGVAGAGETPGGRRVERVTYVFESSGTHTLPAVTVKWYDPASGKPSEAVAPAITVEVGRAGAGLGLAPTGDPFSGEDWWPAWLDGRVFAGLVGLAVIALAAFGLRRRMPAWWHTQRKAWKAAWRELRGPLPPLNP